MSGQDDNDIYWDPLVDWDPMNDDWDSQLNAVGFDVTTDPQAALTGASSTDPVRHCAFFRKHGYCMDGEYCAKKHIRNTDKNLYVDKEPVPCANIRNPFFECAPYALLLTQVTYYEAPNVFHAIFPYKGKDFKHIEPDIVDCYISQVADSPGAKLIDEIGTELQKFYDTRGRIDNINIEVSFSELVCVKLLVNNKYYRALIRNIDYEGENQVYEALLVDIGSIHTVHREQIYPLPQMFLLEPSHSFRCRLDVIAPGIHDDQTSSTDQYDWTNNFNTEIIEPTMERKDVHTKWPEESSVVFKKFTRSKFLFAKILSFDEEFEIATVDLIDPKTGVSLKNELIDMGLALSC